MHSHRLGLRALCATAAFASASLAQELPLSGTSGLTLYYASSPAGAVSQLFGLAPAISSVPIPIGATIAGQPSRWQHQRRTLGGVETAIQFIDDGLIVTPFGDAPGNGKLHVIDGRVPGLSIVEVPTANPACYEVAVCPSLKQFFVAEDDGLGNTTLRGYSYVNRGNLLPLSPATITLPGEPAAYVSRIGVDDAEQTLHVGTVAGFHVIQLAATGTQMTLVGAAQLPSSTAPATNPVSVVLGGVRRWIAGTLDYAIGASDVDRAGYVAWTSNSFDGISDFGIVPSVPSKFWVPAAGASELALVSDGTTAYAYFLLREPKPNTFFVKSSAIGAVRISAANPPAVGTILLSDIAGEPFAIPTTSGNRVAFETSFGPPFVFDPIDGGERVMLLYSPLDSLGLLSTFGVVSDVGPLGGRISTKGMDRPLWSRDGSRLVATTSHFPGAPNPGMPGIEVLDVPASVALTQFQSPDVVVPNPTFPNQSILFGGSFLPRNSSAVSFLNGLSFVGNAFHDGIASVCLTPFGEIGQKQIESPNLTIPSSVPGFRSILPAKFDDANGGVLPFPPAHFGARRTSFNVLPGFGFTGVVMFAAAGDEVLMQSTGTNVLASLGIGLPIATQRFPLPASWTTSTEFLSL